ncbi:T9SS-dependent choice-of-anchor J family protein [Rufibacter psychrotolerans]|uniref:T9SS-dependent choice-of-anchor J family protein n=1 Tax=Rufibacter psychrotolerans TaxID=2812556 RepID=UPI001967712F|nr:choice-of-anchor J domain-containing protein [Rufibacter sp. SYSU D00308]
MVKHVQKVSLCLAAVLWFYSGAAWGQIKLSGGSYQETFDGMGASGTALPTGWQAQRLAGTGTPGEHLTPQVTDGSSSSGAVYNVGTNAATDRALGTLASGSTIPAFGASFANTSGSDITKLEVMGVMEQWRTGTSNSALETVAFEYSTNATSLTTGTWTAVTSLDLVEKVTGSTESKPVNGNDAAHRTEISGTLTLKLATGSTVWFRWKDANDVGFDGIYALDEVQVIPTYTGVDKAAPVVSVTSPAHGATNVPTQVDVQFTFNEPVQAGTGQISFAWQGGSLSRSASDPQILYNGNKVTLQGVQLQPEVSYAVTIDAAAFQDEAGNFFGGIAPGAFAFTTSATATPVLATSAGSLAFPLTQVSKYSTGMEYDLSAQGLQEAVTITVTGPFQISKTKEENAFGTAPLTFTPAQLAAAQKVYVRFNPWATTGNTGTITHQTAGGRTVTVSLTGAAFNPAAQNFEACGTDLPGGWTQVSVTGPQSWGCTTYGRTGNAVQMNGYGGGNQQNEDWLISPALDLATGYQFPVLSFWSRTAYAGPSLRLMVSTNYSGTGNPLAAGVTWTQVNGLFPEAATDTWTESKDINLVRFKEPKVYIAFVYNSTTSAAARWTLDDFEVKNSPVAPPALVASTLNVLADQDFGLVNPGATVDKTFTFSIENLASGVTLQVPAPFSLSKNGTDFAATLAYTQAEAAVGTFTVRFTAPDAPNKAYAGRVTFKADNLDQQIGYLTASVLNKDNTFDVVTWNIEWFGSAANGPGNEELQKANVKKVIEALDADVYAFQEISNAEAFNSLKALLPAYDGFMSSYSSNTQEVAFFFKKATVSEVKRQYLLKGVSGINNFWASGRYPYLLEVDATVNGTTKRLHLINIHAKANDSGTPEEALAAYNRRQDDVRVLKDSLDAHFPSASIIMLGDYNDDVDVTVADITSTTASTYQAFAQDGARYTFATLPLSQAGLRSYVARENVIDHIMYSNELADFYIANSARIVIPFAAVGATTPDGYTTTTSDHLPTIARFNLNGPLGVLEDSWAAGFRVYPNPSKGAVTLKLPAHPAAQKLRLTLYSVRGEVVLEVTGTEQGISEQLSRKLGVVAWGLYLVKVQAGTHTYQARLLKD